MSNNISVKEITLVHLKKGGFDGLYNDSCGCTLDNLIPCGFAGIEGCKAGYLQAGNVDSEGVEIGPVKL